VSAKIKVINPVWNGNGRLKRKVAEHYVSEGRAEWVGEDLLRLDLSHPQNQAAADRASAWAKTQRKAEGLGPVNAFFQRPTQRMPQWARVADGGEKNENCIFLREPMIIHIPGRERPLRQYEGKRFFDDGREERITRIFNGRGKRPRSGVRAKFVTEISDAMLADPGLLQTVIEDGKVVQVDVPRSVYAPPSTTARHHVDKLQISPGEAKAKREKLEANKFAGR
jgi:hypothetical protein